MQRSPINPIEVVILNLRMTKPKLNKKTEKDMDQPLADAFYKLLQVNAKERMVVDAPLPKRTTR